MIVEQKITNKPWGHEILWAHTDEYVGKIICIKSGEQLSRQYHKDKEETIFVLTGALLLEIGMGEKLEQIYLKKGQSYHIKRKTIHRFCAVFGDVDLAEVSTPQLDDVVRLEDDYDRS